MGFFGVFFFGGFVSGFFWEELEYLNEEDHPDFLKKRWKMG